MKSSVSLMLLLICTVVLAARQSQAKKGCSAYGLACYGGHGKRSLNMGANGNGLNVLGQDDMHPDGLLPVYQQEMNRLNDDDNDMTYARYRMLKIMRNWLAGGRLRHENVPDTDYSISAENNIRDAGNNNFLN